MAAALKTLAIFDPAMGVRGAGKETSSEGMNEYGL